MVIMSSGLTLDNIRECFGNLSAFQEVLTRLNLDTSVSVLNLTESRKRFGHEVGIKVHTQNQESFYAWLAGFSKMTGDGTAQSINEEDFQEWAQELWSMAV